jgi:hypothetical protein
MFAHQVLKETRNLIWKSVRHALIVLLLGLLALGSLPAILKIVDDRNDFLEEVIEEESSPVPDRAVFCEPLKEGTHYSSLDVPAQERYFVLRV